MPPMPLYLLAILAVPAAVILIPSPPLKWPWLVALGIASVLVALEIVVGRVALGSAPDRLISRQEARKAGVLVAYAAAIAIAAGALFVGVASVTAAIVILAIAAAWVVIWWPPFLRTSRVHHSVSVGQDPAIVFEFLADARNAPAWHDSYESVEKVTPGPIGPGTRFSAHIKLPDSAVPKGMAAPIEGIEEIIDYEPYSRYTARAVVGSNRDPNLSVTTIKAVAAGSLVTYRFEGVLAYEPAVIGGMLFGLRFGKTRRDRRAANWARAKEVIESRGQATP